MRKMFFVAAAVAALAVLGSSTAQADHGRHRAAQCDPFGYPAPRVNYYGYRGSPYYYGRYEVHRYVLPNPYVPPCHDPCRSGYVPRYGYAPYGTTLGVYGNRISFSIGF